jgi:uncharacterized membrane protein
MQEKAPQCSAVKAALAAVLLSDCPGRPHVILLSLVCCVVLHCEVACLAVTLCSLATCGDFYFVAGLLACINTLMWQPSWQSVVQRNALYNG